MAIALGPAPGWTGVGLDGARTLLCRFALAHVLAHLVNQPVGVDLVDEADRDRERLAAHCPADDLCEYAGDDRASSAEVLGEQGRPGSIDCAAAGVFVDAPFGRAGESGKARRCCQNWTLGRGWVRVGSREVVPVVQAARPQRSRGGEPCGGRHFGGARGERNRLRLHKLDICLLDPANPAAVTNLTDNGETSIDEKPVWSPDGKKVAFISNFGVGGSTRNLFVMEPEAPEQGFNLAVQVTHFTSGVPLEEPVWSPDGTRLAFVLGNSESNDKIEVANSNGATATPLVVTEHGVHPSWSPDSGKIAFSYLEQVYTTVADGSAFPTAVAGATGNEPVWSPDGSRIAFGEHATLRNRQPRDHQPERGDAGHPHLRGAVHLRLLVALGLAGRLPRERRRRRHPLAGRERRRLGRPCPARVPEPEPERSGALVVAER